VVGELDPNFLEHEMGWTVGHLGSSKAIHAGKYELQQKHSKELAVCQSISIKADLASSVDRPHASGSLHQELAERYSAFHPVVIFPALVALIWRGSVNGRQFLYIFYLVGDVDLEPTHLPLANECSVHMLHMCSEGV
jgi:hypothetical protein